MTIDRNPVPSILSIHAVARVARFLPLVLAGARLASAQESPQAPLAPPPEHEVHRMSNAPEAAAPPSLPPEEIIRKFSQKEDQYMTARAGYGFRKTIRIDEFDREGKLVGQYLSASEQIRAANGRMVSKVIEHPQNALHLVTLEPEEAKELDRIPPFPMNTSQLAKYDLKFIGDEQIDEILCYIFQVKPKGVDRTNAYFEGVIWVDSKYLEVVKTYGKWVNELGDVQDCQVALYHLRDLPRKRRRQILVSQLPALRRNRASERRRLSRASRDQVERVQAVTSAWDAIACARG